MEQQQTETTTESAETGGSEFADADILAELASLADDGEGGEAEPAADEETADAETETDEVEAEAEQPEAADETPAEDPELAKRLEQIQRQEQRAKDAVAQQRAEFEKERADFQKQREEWQPKLEQFEALKARVAYDPAAVLMELGMGEADFETAARQLYALSVEGKKNPALREQSARSLREKETMTKLQQLEQKHQELLQQIQEREQRAEQERQVNEYISQVEKAVGDDATIVSRMLAKSPQKARALLREAASQLYNQTGEVPDAQDVVAHLEKIKRAELDELGLDIPAAGSSAATKPKTPVKASEKAVAATLSSDLGTTTKPRTEPLNEEDIDAQILRELREGRIDDA